MDFGEVIMALFSYPILLLAPGFLWTFLFSRINTQIGIIKRIIISIFLSLISVPLFLSLILMFFDIQFNQFLVILSIFFIAILPVLISLFSNYLPNRLGISQPSRLFLDIKTYPSYVIKEMKKKPLQHLFLISILAIGIFLTILPHIGYGLPIHTDEWHYMAYGDNLISSDSAFLENPYFGGQRDHWEFGFIVFISIFKAATNLSWPFIFSTLPAVLFASVILVSYLIGKEFGYGLHAAFIVSLTPSTLQYLGPVFLVPISLGILLILLTFYVVAFHKTKLRYPVIFSALIFSFLIHPPTGAYLFVILFGILMLDILKKQKWDSIYLTCVLLSFFALIFYTPQSLMNNFNLTYLTTSGEAFLPLIGIEDISLLFGIVPSILAIIGIAIFLKSKKYSLPMVFFTMAMFLILMYYAFPNFYQIQAMYDRAILLLLFIFGIIAGMGIYAIQKNVSKSLFILLVVCILALSFKSHINEPYYEIITPDEYQDFVWIRENINETYDRAILDPWKAIAFTPVTGKMVYFRIPQGPGLDMQAEIEPINAFFAGNCTDSQYLINNGIKIVYTSGSCTNSDLIEVHENVYLFQPVP